MQDRRWKCADIKEDLKSIRKFSILNCIRERVFDVLSELPLPSIEYLCQQDIDGVIRRNLLRERKVRFSADNQFEGEEKISKSEEEMEKENVLEEMDIVLKVLGSDRRNRLVIENFELLEERIARVEQRLSGLIRKLPIKNANAEFEQSQIKINVEQVRMDIENFVNKFNEVFSSDFEITSSSPECFDHGRQTFSSTNRLKFEMLSRLPDMSSLDGIQEPSSTSEKIGSKQKKVTASSEGSNGVAGVALKRQESKTHRNDLKAVDSLISLRERFKAQSAKWLQMSNKSQEDTKNETKNEKEVAEVVLSKENNDAKQIVIGTVTQNKLAERNVHPTFIIPEGMSSAEPTPHEVTGLLTELKKSVKENKSVQTAPRKKKPRSRSKAQKPQQIVNGKEVWEQYVNKGVLRYSKSSLNINESNKLPKEAKIVKAKPKPERLQKRPKLTKIATNIKQTKNQNTKTTQKAEAKSEQSQKKHNLQNKAVSTQLKEYKKIFLLKLPKAHSVPANSYIKPPSKNTESKLLAAIKESYEPKQVTENLSKNKSLIRLYPKAFKPKPKLKERKQSKTEVKPANSTTKAATQKLNSNQILYKIRNGWICETDRNSRLIKKNFDDLPQMLQKTNAKNRKLTQKLKKKKSDLN